MTSDLITRLSKLDAPDREVDAAIAETFGYPQEVFGNTFGTDNVDGPEMHHDAATWSGGGILWSAPHYTASVDAAIALAERVLPESVARRLIIFNSSPAKAGFDGTPERGKLFYFEAATPAIALCIALLRAKEASKL